MAQYKTGSVTVTNGSATVTGLGTLWSAEVSAGDIFTIVGSNAWYEVASVASNTSLTLTANYGGTSASGASYAITRDFTTNNGWPYPQKGDIETASLIKRALTDIDSGSLSTVDINGGTIDGTTIGASTPSTGAFTTLSTSGAATLASGTVNGSEIANVSSSQTLTNKTLTSPTVNTATISGGTIDNAVIGGTTPAAGGFTTVIANTVYAQTIASVSSFSWDSATSSPAASSTNPYGGGAPVVTNIHRRIRRCVMNDAGEVVYYLDPNDSTKKEDGSNANLDGTDGQVMVEIPAFYSKREKSGTITTWSISDVPLSGFELEPAFIKDGVFTPFRYYGAYDACYWDDSASAYASGLNLDALTVDTANDTLASVAGVYPIVGVTRATCRTLAANRGGGWCVADFWLVQAIQLLYLIEYQTFYSQSVLGSGNTNGSYSASSSVQTDSPHTIAGASNAWGNNSTDGTQPSAGAKPGTAYMSYRGIENFFGNCWNWIDGFNILDNQAYVSSDRADFADDTSTGYQSLGSAMPTSNGYPTNHQDIDHAFLPASIGGGSTTYWTDYYYQAAGWRVALFGGRAADGVAAGAFWWALSAASWYRGREVGARLAR